MQEGRKRNLDSRMKGCINELHQLTDIYLPRKCDYTDKLITSKDRSSIQLPFCGLNADGTINLSDVNTITICGFVRGTGKGDEAIEKILQEKNLI